MFDSRKASVGLAATIGQILLLDLVFSLDSIITAVGMTEHVPIMVVAVVVAVSLMLLAATPLANFINGNPTIVMLALAFLFLIGTTLIAEGFGAHVPRGYIYTAMSFSAAVEALNILSRRARQRRAAAVGTAR
jgi:predicted tellurium resistance membrane protein TerC